MEVYNQKISAENNTNYVPRCNDKYSQFINKSLKIFHQNVRSITNKRNRLEVVISEIEPDVLVIAEHSLKIGNITEVKYGDYTIASSFCRSNLNGGGVCILPRQGIKYRQMKDIQNFSIERDFELTGIEILHNRYECVIIGIYIGHQMVNLRFLWKNYKL